MTSWLLAWAMAAERPHPLGDERFRFCHEVGADGADVQAWCELLKEVPPHVCPEMRETCEREAFDAGCLEGSDADAGRGLAGEPEDDLDLPELSGWDAPACGGCAEDSRGCDGRRGRGIPAAVRWLVALALAVLVLAAVRVVTRLRRVRPVALPDGGAIGELPVAEDGLPALPHEALLAAARRALEQGRWADAVALGRAAALRGLGAAGELTLHPSRTDREYVRALRGASREDLAEVVRAAEKVRWEGRAPDAERAASVLDRVTRLLGVALVCVIALPARAGERHGPWGDAAIVELLRAEGHEVELGLKTLSDLDEDVHALWLDLVRVEPSDEDVGRLVTWVQEGGILILAGDAERIPDFEWWVAPWDVGPPDRLAGALAGMAPPRLPLGPNLKLCGEGTAWVLGDGEAEDGCPGALVLHRTFGSGHLVGVADSRLLTNGAMMHDGNAEIVRQLLRRGADAGLWELPDPTRVALALVAGRAPTSASALADARLLPFALHVVLLWALAVWAWGVPPLPLPPPAPVVRRDAAEHAAALGRRWAQRADAAHAARAWVGLWWQRLDGRGLRELALRRGRDPEDAARVERDARAMVRGAPFPEQEARSLVEELWRLTRQRR